MAYLAPNNAVYYLIRKWGQNTSKKGKAEVYNYTYSDEPIGLVWDFFYDEDSYSMEKIGTEYVITGGLGETQDTFTDIRIDTIDLGDFILEVLNNQEMREKYQELLEEDYYDDEEE